MRFLPPITGDRALLEVLRQLCAFADRAATRVLLPGEVIQRDDNPIGVWLLTGEHGGMALTRANARMAGAPGAALSSTLVCNVDCKVEGVIFDGTKLASSQALVTVGETATAIFIGCHFQRGLYAGNHVTIASGGKAHFHGCTFGPASMPVGAVPVNNAGLAANVSIHGGSNKTGRAHVNVTNFGETT